MFRVGVGWGAVVCDVFNGSYVSYWTMLGWNKLKLVHITVLFRAPHVKIRLSEKRSQPALQICRKKNLVAKMVTR